MQNTSQNCDLILQTLRNYAIWDAYPFDEDEAKMESCWEDFLNQLQVADFECVYPFHTEACFLEASGISHHPLTPVVSGIIRSTAALTRLLEQYPQLWEHSLLVAPPELCFNELIYLAGVLFSPEGYRWLQSIWDRGLVKDDDDLIMLLKALEWRGTEESKRFLMSIFYSGKLLTERTQTFARSMLEDLND